MDFIQSRLLRRRRPFANGFLAGLGAGIGASGVMLLLSILVGGLSLPEEFGSELTALMPLSLFAFLHQLIGDDAKYYFYSIILVGQCLVFAFGGAIFNRQANPKNGLVSWKQGLLLALILWLFAGLILLPLTGSGVFGAYLTVGLYNGLLSLGVVGLVFGVLFVLFQHLLPRLQEIQAPRQNARRYASVEAQASRRALIRQGLIVGGVIVAGVALWEFITEGLGSLSAPKVPVARLLQGYRSKISPPPTPHYGQIQPVQNLTPYVTSNSQYYVVSKNFTDPTVTAQEWSLKISGQVEHPFTLSYQELLAQPMQQQYESMECISNEVGGNLMSNGLWEGTRLANLLQQAGVKSGATKVVLHAYDDYADSIHLSKALEPTTLVAVHMNGVPLPDGHGFPARVLVPGIFGMKHVKWLTNIEVVNYDFQGYWQQRGWDDAAPVLLTSRIDTPFDGSTLAVQRQTYIAGVAFSGNKGISEVDVSTDSGTSWLPATLQRPSSDLTWVIWEIPWTPSKAGNYVLTVRAIDLQGDVQTPNIAPPLPSGATGYHSISVTVS